jgi:quercetin dioxygenase-like cupin family protein
MLRFGRKATIHAHAADFEVDVICIEGAGFVRVGGATSRFGAGQRVRWPSGVIHRLWTENSMLVTLRVEHPE